MSEQTPRDDYLMDFKGDLQKEALKHALDIRKFEIELYWKRAIYFWAFIATAFGGYLALQRDGDTINTYIVTCLGFLFSLAWYFVNRGSGAWQRNWETHVDLLEDEIMGPLYKSVMNRRTYKLYYLFQPFFFSPSRINNVLALIITMVWLLLLARSGLKAGAFCLPLCRTVVAMSLLTLIGAILLIWKGRTRPFSDDEIKIDRQVRRYP
jgi:hypothetical protein